MIQDRTYYDSFPHPLITQKHSGITRFGIFAR